MEIPDLIQLMRTCSIASVRKQLKALQKHNPEKYTVIVTFYEIASRRP